MDKVGRKTDLTDELLKKIKEGILSGKNLKETAEFCEIDPQKLYNWHYDDYLNIATKIEGWKRDRKLNLADKNIEGILQLPIDDKDFVKTVSDMSKFVKETLDKKNYSKRTESTGADGKELPTPILYVQSDNSNEEDSSPKEEN